MERGLGTQDPLEHVGGDIADWVLGKALAKQVVDGLSFLFGVGAERDTEGDCSLNESRDFFNVDELSGIDWVQRHELEKGRCEGLCFHWFLGFV